MDYYSKKTLFKNLFSIKVLILLPLEESQFSGKLN